MTAYLGDIALGKTIDLKFCTVTTTGAPTQLAGTPVVSVYEDNDVAQITAGVTLTVDFDGVTGLNHVRIVATSGNGFQAASNYQVVITTGTVGGTSVVGYVVAQFSIEARSALRPTTVDRTLTIESDGMAHADLKEWLGVAPAALTASGYVQAMLLRWLTDNAAGTPNALATNRVDASVGAMAANTLTAAALAADAAGEIADAVLDEDMTAHQTQGTLGQAIGDPVLDANTIYGAVVTDASGATVGADTTAIKAKTDQLTFTIANKVDSSIQAAGDFAQAAADKVWLSASRTLTAFGFTVAANVTQWLGAAVAALSANGFVQAILQRWLTDNAAGTPGALSNGNVKADLKEIDEGATNGNNATFNLKKLNIVNNTGDAMIVNATGGNGAGIRVTGNGLGPGLRIESGATGAGIQIVGDAAGMEISSSSGGNSGVSITGNGEGLSIVGGIGGGGSGIGIYSQGTSPGIYLEGGLPNGAGIEMTGQGTGAGLRANGGATGHGIFLIGAGGGKSLNAPQGIAPDDGINLSVTGIWHHLLTAIMLAGSIGKLIKDNLNAAISTRAVPGDAMTLTAAERNAVADANLDRVDAVETGVAPRGAWRLMLSALAGKLSGAGTGTETFRNAVADSKARITATVDASGNRTAVTIDQT